MQQTKPDASAPHVLIVDDDSMVRESLKMLFVHYGWAVETMASGQDALAALPFIEYKLAIVDQLMQGMNGLELARRLKAVSPAPVFLLTGCIEPSLRQAAEAAGVDRYFAKPVSASAMIRALEELAP